MEKKVTSHITAGLVVSLILIVLDLIAGFAGFKFAIWFRWIPTLILCIGIIVVCIYHSNQKNNYVTFGNVFAFGFKTSAVIACLMLIYTLLSLFVIFPETKDIAIDEARKQMESQGNLSEDQIDQPIGMTQKFFLPFAIGGTVIGTLIVGAISALLGAAFAKKKPVSPFDQPTK